MALAKKDKKNKKDDEVRRKARIALICCSDELRALSDEAKDKELQDKLYQLSENIYDLIGREIYEDRNYQDKYEL